MKFQQETTLKVLADTPQIKDLSVIVNASPQQIADLDLIIAIAYRVGRMDGVNAAFSVSMDILKGDRKEAGA